MKKVMLLALTVGFGSLVNASAGTKKGTKTGPGHERLAKYLATATEKEKKGIYESAKEGALGGAAAVAAVMMANIGGGLAGTGFDVNKLKSSPEFSYMTRVALIGGTYAALLNMWNDAFRKNSTPEWLAQMKVLGDKKNQVSESKVLYLGVPSNMIGHPAETDWTDEMIYTGASKYIRKAYLLSSGLNIVDDVLKDNHYELYLMPKDQYLVDVFFAANDFLLLNKTGIAKDVLFIALRPTPGVTKSPYNAKNMARIVIGFRPGAQRSDVVKLIAELDGYFKKDANYLNIGLGVQPRHSQTLNNLMYVGYGSPDYKDSEQGKKEYANKAKTFWQRWWSGASDEDMAFKDSSLAIRPSEGR